MTEIEQQLQMPPGAEQIAKYDRYYMRQAPDTVVGTFVGSGERGERKWVSSIDQLPAIDDGGCGVVNIIFDLKTKKSTTFCNGVA